MIDISKIKKGMTRKEVKSFLGEPDLTGGTSRKYHTPCVYRYGQIEFGFGPYKDSGLDYVMDVGKSGLEHNFLIEPPLAKIEKAIKLVTDEWLGKNNVIAVYDEVQDDKLVIVVMISKKCEINIPKTCYGYRIIVKVGEKFHGD